MPLQKRGLVLGGAASGKSSWAENLVLSLGRPLVYVATAEAWDVEMAHKISRHRERRDARWTTVEAPRDIGGALRNVMPTDIVLIDCATMWLTNRLLAEDDLGETMAVLMAALEACPAPAVVVSNEVGLGIVPDTPLGRSFREAQGALNQRLGAWADLVVFVAAGLPLVLKGSL